MTLTQIANAYNTNSVGNYKGNHIDKRLQFKQPDNVGALVAMSDFKSLLAQEIKKLKVKQVKKFTTACNNCHGTGRNPNFNWCACTNCMGAGEL